MEKDQIIYDKRKAMGESIRAMRTAQGWEQDQLAKIAGISISNIRSVEAGKYAVLIVCHCPHQILARCQRKSFFCHNLS